MRRVAGSLPLALVLLDVTAVSVLVPDIRLDLGSSSSGAQWMLNAYLLAVAAPLPVLMRAKLPPRALVAAGALALAAGAVVCATADSTAVLMAGRAAQGAGAAALLAHTARVGVVPAALPALALALGPLLGGVFAEQNWWRLFFWAGVPLAAVAATVTLVASPAERSTAPGDIARRLAFGAGLAALTIAWVQSEVWAWGWWAVLMLAGAVLLRAARLSEAQGAALGWATAAGCVTALVFLMPQYFQLARNLSGLRSGALLLALTVPAVLAWAISRWHAGRVPGVPLALAGLAGASLGLAALIAIDAASSYALVIGALCIAGAGLGALGAAVDGVTAWESPPPPLAPALAGAALGLALAGAAFQFAESDDRAAGASFEQALASGVGWAAVCLVVLLAAAALVSLRLRPAASAARPAAES